MDRSKTKLKTKSSPVVEDWRMTAKNIQGRLKYILASGFMTDFTVRVIGDEAVEYKVHGALLASASRVFESIINSNLKEGISKVLEITDMSPNIFNILLQHIYGQDIKIKNIAEAWETYLFADKYLIYDLSDFCIRYIEEDKDPGSACICLEMAIRLNIASLKDSKLRLIRQITREVVTNENFLEADIHTVQLILEQEKSSISEFDLFKAVENWIISSVAKRGEKFKEIFCNLLIPKFCFLTMTPKEFTEGPVKSNFLKHEDIIAIYANLASENSSIPLPMGFSTNRRVFTNEIKLDSLPKTVKFYEWSCVAFVVNKDIRLKTISIYTQEGNKEEKYDEDVTVRFMLDGKDDWQSSTKFTGDAYYSSNLLIELAEPLSVMKGRKYVMRIWSLNGSYLTVDLKGAKICNEDITVSFFIQSDLPPSLPIASMLFDC